MPGPQPVSARSSRRASSCRGGRSGACCWQTLSCCGCAALRSAQCERPCRPARRHRRPWLPVVPALAPACTGRQSRRAGALVGAERRAEQRSRPCGRPASTAQACSSVYGASWARGSGAGLHPRLLLGSLSHPAAHPSDCSPLLQHCWQSRVQTERQGGGGPVWGRPTGWPSTAALAALPSSAAKIRASVSHFFNYIAPRSFYNPKMSTSSSSTTTGGGTRFLSGGLAPPP